MKYGPDDDAIGAGIFSGRYTSTIVAAGYIAKAVLKKFGIEVFSYVKEIAGAVCPDVAYADILDYENRYKQMRCDYDPFYQEVYVSGRINPEMRFLEKMKVFGEIENEIDDIRGKAPKIVPEEIKEKYNVHHILHCPDIEAATAMVDACNKISATGDSAGGLVEIVVTGVPAGLGEPVFNKMDAELGRLLGIGAVKGVEIGAGFAVKDMTGIESNDQMHIEDGKVVFDSNNAGGITGGLTTGQPIVARVAVKPTPTIDKPQHTIDKYTMENKAMEAITRRDPTIAARIWPVVENYTAMVILDNLIAQLGAQAVMKQVK
jgi:chorismate synthase